MNNLNRSKNMLDQVAADKKLNPGLIGDDARVSKLDPHLSKSVYVTDEQDHTGDMNVQTPEHQDMSSMVGHASEPDDADDLDEFAESVGVYTEQDEQRQALNLAEEVSEAEQAQQDSPPA